MKKLVLIFYTTITLSASSADLTPPSLADNSNWPRKDIPSLYRFRALSDIINAGEKKCIQVKMLDNPTLEQHLDQQQMGFILYVYRTFREAHSYVDIDGGVKFLNEALENAIKAANAIKNVELKDAFIADLKHFNKIDWKAFAKASLDSEATAEKYLFKPIR